ncbi:MAG: hypothetical protein ACFE0S_13170 [Rhodospirillales bacterium]
MSEFEERKKYTVDHTSQLRGLLGKAADLLGEKACVYSTGSFGRLEAGPNSDLDLFIVGLNKHSGEDPPESRLSNLDSICVRAELIAATRELQFPEFDGDGKYLAHYSVHDMVRNLGTPEDDAENTLTGRLLLFLESKPLLGEQVYRQVIEEVIVTYWRDYEDHKLDFIPAYLTNDILRLWRTFCVNYEARTETTSEEKKIKRKVKNYKLKHSRMLTCYSALLYLLGVLRAEGTVSVDKAAEMSLLTPTERLRGLREDKLFEASHGQLDRLLAQYEAFLESTKEGDGALKEVFSDKKAGDEKMRMSYTFGDIMYETLISFGTSSKSDAETKFCRLMLV